LTIRLKGIAHKQGAVRGVILDADRVREKGGQARIGNQILDGLTSRHRQVIKGERAPELVG